MGKGHTVRGGCVVIPSDAKAWESLPMLTEHSGHKSSHGAAVCGESRTYGDNGGGGETGHKVPRPVPTHSIYSIISSHNF